MTHILDAVRKGDIMSRRILGQLLLLALGIALLAGGRNLLAVPVPTMSLQSLIDGSDLIVVAQIDRTESVGITEIDLGSTRVKAAFTRADVTILTVLKGSTSHEEFSVQYLVPDIPLGYRTLSVDAINVLFLKAEVAGGYQFTSPYYPSLPAQNDAIIPESDTLGKVLSEEQAVLASPRQPVTIKEEAIWAVRSVIDSRAIDVLVPSLGDSSTRIRLDAASELAADNNVQGATVACNALLSPPSDAPDYVLFNLQVGIKDGVKDERAIPCLSRLLHSNDNKSREAAAVALRHTGSQAAISALVESLNDPDQRVRWEGAVGLADITAQPKWRPNLIQFHYEEAKFVEHWKAWAANR
jgi:hypothetical protein